MRIRPALLGALAAAAVVAAIPAARVWHASRSARLGPLEASPPAPGLSVRIGERVQFSARARGAAGFSWRLWGRPVSSEPTWSYVPGPEEAGWQQVTVEVTGRNGDRVSRSWDIGVVAAVLPEIEEVTPAPGPVALLPGEKGRFRCRAHLPGGRPTDRLAFEWKMDDRPVLTEERPAAEAVSEFVLLPGADPGPHRLRLHVTEDDRSVSIVDWAVEVRAAEAVPAPRVEAAPPDAVPVPPVEAPPVFAAVPSAPAEPAGTALFTAPGPPRAAPLREPVSRPMSPHLIRAPGSRQLRRHLGERLVLEARVEPEDASVSYRWSVDGRPMRRHAARLEYAPTSPGRHRVEVTALAGRRAIGHEAWLVSVTAPDVPSTRAARSRAVESKEGVSLGRTEPMRPVEAAPPALPVSATSPSLAEADVRRWLEEYARAWSRKDIAALRRMGQFRSAADAARLERYFESVDALHVDVHVLALMIDGPRAVVEFERIDTVTDPSGRHQRLRLPPMRKEIEKSPEGFRFTGRAGHG